MKKARGTARSAEL